MRETFTIFLLSKYSQMFKDILYKSVLHLLCTVYIQCAVTSMMVLCSEKQSFNMKAKSVPYNNCFEWKGLNSNRARVHYWLLCCYTICAAKVLPSQLYTL